MRSFRPTIEIIGINPFVFVPDDILKDIFSSAQKDRGPIPIHGVINGKPYIQTLVKYSGEWRLYINTTMLKDSPKHVGETIDICVGFDPRSRKLPLHPKLKEALDKDLHALRVFDSLIPSRRHEINRYIHNLKADATVNANVQKAIDHLNDKGKFAGRDKL